MWRRAKGLALGGMLPFVAASAAQAQRCVGVLRGDRAAAMARTMASRIESIGLRPVDSMSRISIGREVQAGPSGSLVVMLAGARTGVSGSQYAALAGPDSLCQLQARGVSYGIRADTAAVHEWNDALPHVAPNLQVVTALGARELAAAALAYATAWAWDTVWTSATAASDGWNVTGMLTTGGWHRLFFVRLTKDAQIETLFLQYPPDPPASR